MKKKRLRSLQPKSHQRKRSFQNEIVTIQLPIYNEYNVVERLLAGVSNIQWPKDKLDIQVIDDSDDETRDLLKQLVLKYRKQNFQIHLIHRKNRNGFKAGALKEALKKAKGNFISIFDADFVPSTNFLKKSMPYFENLNVGMVQSRWSHLNSKTSLLTRAQAMGIDGHFILEQKVRSDYGLWLNFNGTAGVWRKECILEAGNWQSDTLTEDLDLSYRAELAGWKFLYASEIDCPAEIPDKIHAFKNQQFRWCKGSIQTALKLSKRIFASDFHWLIKSEAIIRLFKYSVHPLMLLNIILSGPLLYFIQEHSYFIFSKDISTLLIYGAFFSFLSLASVFFYIYSQKEIYENWIQKAIYFPALMLVGSGVCISNTRAYIEALLNKKSGFQRTPKSGSSETKGIRLRHKKIYPSKHVSLVVFLEVFFTFYCLGLSYYSFQKEIFIFSALMCLYGFGFLYVSAKGIQEKLQ